MNYLINKPTSISNIDFDHINDDIPIYGNNFDYNGQKSNWCVYIHINKINKKRYVGISSNLKVRWTKTGHEYKCCTSLYEDIKKYGFDSFEHIVLMNGLTESMASEIEKQLIVKLNSHVKNGTGYNIALGGTHGIGMDRSFSFKPVYMYDLKGIYVQSFESITQAEYLMNNKRGNAISKSIKNKNGFAYGYLWSFEYKESIDSFVPKLLKYRDEINKPKSDYGPILQISFSGEIIKEYKDIYYIFDDKNYRYSVLQCCKHINFAPSYKGFFWIFKSDYSKEIVDQLINERNMMLNNKYTNRKKVDYNSPIIQYDKNGNFVKRYESLKSINEPNFKINTIIAALTGKNRIAYDYQWRYESDPVPSVIADKYPKNAKKIARIDIINNEITKYESLTDAYKENNYDKHKLTNCANGIIESAYGYVWRFIDDNGNIIEPK